MSKSLSGPRKILSRRIVLVGFFHESAARVGAQSGQLNKTSVDFDSACRLTIHAFEFVKFETDPARYRRNPLKSAAAPLA
jgi:hypothetical protein